MTAETMTAIMPQPAALLSIAMQFARGQDAEEIAAEVAARMWCNRAGLVGGPSLLGWAWRVSKNLAAEKARTPWRARLRPLEEGLAVAESTGKSSRLPDWFLSLPRHHRMILDMAAAGVSYLEMAERLGVPLNTVRSRVSRAREFARRKLS